MPLSAFERTMKRVDGLLELHQQIHGRQGRPLQHVSDVLRGALVLTVGALDAHIAFTIEHALPTLIRRGSAGAKLEKWVKENPAVTLECVAEADPARSLARAYAEAELSIMTFQKAEVIDSVLRQHAGCRSPFEFAATSMEAQGRTATAATLRCDLNEVVERRNRIAHDGDTVVSGRAKGIQMPYVQSAARTVRLIAEATSSVMGERLTEIT